MRMNSGNARRLGLALALTSGALAVAAPAALAAPAISSTPFSGLANTGTTAVAVTGTGFTSDAVNQALGLYVGVTATVSGTIYADMGSAQYVFASSTDAQTRLATDGTFSTTVTASRRFTSNGTDIDCAVVQCVIRTWRAHGNPTDANVLATQAIRFAPDISTSVTVTPNGDLSRTAPTTVTITGSGFDPSLAGGRGLYVVYGPKNPNYWTDTSAYGGAKYVFAAGSPGASTDRLNADGTFSTTLDVQPVYTTRSGTTIDCRVIECDVLTFAAQGRVSPDFDTTTPLTFAPPAPTAEVSPTTELNRDAATLVTIRGQNYFYRFGAYVGLTATVDGSVLYGDQSTFRWVRTAAMGARTPEETITDGAFTTTISATPTFTTDRGVTVDCRVTQCAISSWPAHSLPTPETLYTNAPLTFAAAQVVVPPPPDERRDPVPSPTPTVVAPKATSAKKAQKVGKKGIAVVGTIAVGSQDATLKPYKLKVKIGKKRYAATVIVPKSVKAGKKATVKVKLSKKAIAALKGRAVKVTAKVKVTAGGKATTVATKATLKGAAVKKKAVKHHKK